MDFNVQNREYNVWAQNHLLKYHYIQNAAIHLRAVFPKSIVGHLNSIETKSTKDDLSATMFTGNPTLISTNN